MMEQSFQFSSTKLKKLWENEQHYSVVDTPEGSINQCVIYFSSNALYAPNTDKAIEDAIEKCNRYEWTKNKVPQARRHIFVRDIYKQWYFNGISETYPTIEKVFELLKTLTQGFESCMCIGCSAGGYAAVLFGCLLKAERILAFNPQFSLAYILEDVAFSRVNPILWQHRHSAEMQQYIDLSPLLKKTSSTIYYFLSAHSEKDIFQSQIIREIHSVKVISFATSNHGIPFLRPVFQPLFSMTQENMDQMIGKCFSPLSFSFKHAGFWPCIKFLWNKAFRWNDLRGVFIQWWTGGRQGI